MKYSIVHNPNFMTKKSNNNIYNLLMFKKKNIIKSDRLLDDAID